MALDDLSINSRALADLDAMNVNIDNLSDVLQELYLEMSKLDETVWKAKEKDKIDQTFIPYLKKFATSYPTYLKNRVEFARTAITAHQKFDEEKSALKEING